MHSGTSAGSAAPRSGRASRRRSTAAVCPRRWRPPGGYGVRFAREGVRARLEAAAPPAPRPRGRPGTAASGRPRASRDLRPRRATAPPPRRASAPAPAERRVRRVCSVRGHAERSQAATDVRLTLTARGIRSIAPFVGSRRASDASDEQGARRRLVIVHRSTIHHGRAAPWRPRGAAGRDGGSRREAIDGLAGRAVRIAEFGTEQPRPRRVAHDPGARAPLPCGTLLRRAGPSAGTPPVRYLGTTRCLAPGAVPAPSRRQRANARGQRVLRSELLDRAAVGDGHMNGAPVRPPNARFVGSRPTRATSRTRRLVDQHLRSPRRRGIAEDRVAGVVGDVLIGLHPPRGSAGR
jgi:hypothetical protein